MFYGSILFRFVGVVTIWIIKSIYKLKIVSFKKVWIDEKAEESDDLIDSLSSELIQIFVNCFTMNIFIFLSWIYCFKYF